MTYPKMKPCPVCKTDQRIAVYTYESGWSRIECDGCSYIGSCEGRKLDAIRVHNAAANTSGNHKANQALTDMPNSSGIREGKS